MDRAVGHLGLVTAHSKSLVFVFFSQREPLCCQKNCSCRISPREFRACLWDVPAADSCSANFHELYRFYQVFRQ